MFYFLLLPSNSSNSINYLGWIVVVLRFVWKQQKNGFEINLSIQLWPKKGLFWQYKYLSIKNIHNNIIIIIIHTHSRLFSKQKNKSKSCSLINRIQFSFKRIDDLFTEEIHSVFLKEITKPLHVINFHCLYFMSNFLGVISIHPQEIEFIDTNYVGCAQTKI